MFAYIFYNGEMQKDSNKPNVTVRMLATNSPLPLFRKNINYIYK